MIDPSTPFPLSSTNRLCFLKNIIKNPNIIVGDFTYYDDPEDVHNFEKMFYTILILSEIS